MQENIKDAVLSAWTDAWDLGDFGAIRRLVTPDYARTSSSTGKVSSFDEFVDGVLEVRAAFPDLVTRVDRILLDGDHLAVLWTSEGTFTHPLGTVPPTGRRVVTHGCNSSTLSGGLIASEVVTWDSNELLRNLGLPALPSAFEPADEPGDGLSPGARDMLKAFNKQFVTGVTVVTTRNAEGQPRGLAVSSYTSVSLDPPLVLVCVQKTSSTHAELFRCPHFGINILSSEQRDTLALFASKTPDKFADLPWHEGPHGSPLIDDSSASIEVEIKERFQALTHTVLIGRVLHAETTDAPPILYKAGKFYDGRGLSEL
jgi:flavin reductase (DIM6/NTAB) family NADH-FMN oxidoreductase RutF/predicted ester cyclase